MVGKRMINMAMPLCFCLIACSAMADAAEMTAPLPVVQMNPFMLRYMGFTASDALQEAGRRHRISIQEHYASIFLAEGLPAPGRYLADMELSMTNITLHSSLGRTGVYVNLPLLLPTGGFMDGLVNGFHKAFHFPNGNRAYRPNNRYGYALAGAWDSHPGWRLGNITAGLQFPVLRGGSNALALVAGGKAPTANRRDGWSSGTWDGGIGLVDSFRTHAWFGHLEGWYFKPFGKDEIPFISNRAYARASVAIGREGRFFHPVSNRLFSLIVQAQGGASPYRHTGMLALDQNPWLVAVGLRWQDSKQRDWLFSFTENITQHSTQDFSFCIACAFG
jgi:hypothetical protein